MRVHFFQHVDFEGLGAIEDWCKQKDATVTATRFYEDDFIVPKLNDFDLLVVMGGPMSVNEESQYSWLRDEKTLIKSCIENRKPVLGICLGAQLIANSMDAKVYANHTKEIGWFPIKVIGEKSEQAQFFTDGTDVFHWHGETFDLPAGATLLASSKKCVNQAFLLGDSVIGLQFHLEMTPPAIEEIVHNCQHELVPVPYIQSEELILSNMENRCEILRPVLEGMLDYLAGRIL